MFPNSIGRAMSTCTTKLVMAAYCYLFSLSIFLSTTKKKWQQAKNEKLKSKLIENGRLVFVDFVPLFGTVQLKIGNV